MADLDEDTLGSEPADGLAFSFCNSALQINKSLKQMTPVWPIHIDLFERQEVRANSPTYGFTSQILTMAGGRCVSHMDDRILGLKASLAAASHVH